MRRPKTDWGKVIGWAVIGAVGAAVLNGVAQSPSVNPKLRLIAQAAEGQIVQDLESEAFYLLKDGVLYSLT